VHQVGLLPSIGPWVVTLHLWPTSKPHGDSPSFVMLMVGRGWHPMMLCEMRLHPSQETLVLMLCVSKSTFFHPPPSSPPTNKLTLCIRLMAFTRWLMLSLLIPFELTWIRVLHCFEGYSQRWRQRKNFIKIGTLPLGH
jgi:hypothetical protein